MELSGKEPLNPLRWAATLLDTYTFSELHVLGSFHQKSHVHVLSQIFWCIRIWEWSEWVTPQVHPAQSPILKKVKKRMPREGCQWWYSRIFIQHSTIFASLTLWTCCLTYNNSQWIFLIWICLVAFWNHINFQHLKHTVIKNSTA